MNSSVKDRLLEFISYLGISVRQFEKNVGLSNGYVNNIRKSTNKIDEIKTSYPELNIEWLIFGKGKMLNSVHEEAPKHNAKISEIGNYMEVAIFPTRAQCGDSDEYTTDKFYEDWEKQIVIVDKQYRGTYLLFDINGDSMDDGTSDSLLDGDRVLGRQVPMQYWKDKLFYRKWKYFAIFVKGQRPIIKQVTYHNTEEHYIICHSLNPMFSDIKIELKDVVAIFNIVDQVGGKSKFRA